MKSRLGVVAALWRYPVKSMAGERLSRATLGPLGVPGDRLWAFVGPNGRPLSAKRAGELMLCAARFVGEPERQARPNAEIELPDGRRLSCQDPAASEALAAWLKRPGRLAAQAGAHFDARPVHLLTTASLSELSSRRPGSLFNERRFRPNIVVALDEPSVEPFPELAWRGTLRVGSALLALDKPTARCVMTTHPQAGLGRDPAVLEAAIAATRGLVGVYAKVAEPGEARLGDPVALA